MSGRQPSPQGCMRAVSQAPFYAVQLVNGTLGTNGGMVIDPNARVRSVRGDVVPGLYAAGNASASVFGPAYPGGGATIRAGAHLRVHRRPAHRRPGAEDIG